MTTVHATTKPGAPTTDETGRVEALGSAVGEAAGTVKDAAMDGAARLPDVVASARTVIGDANREMQAGSDERLVIGSALTFGLAGGLLIGGANRLLVVLALTPAAMMALTVLDRSARRPDRPRRRL